MSSEAKSPDTFEFASELISVSAFPPITPAAKGGAQPGAFMAFMVFMVKKRVAGGVLNRTYSLPPT